MKPKPNKWRNYRAVSTEAYHEGSYKIMGIRLCKAMCSRELNNDKPCKTGGFQVEVRYPIHRFHSSEEATRAEHWCLNIEGFDLVPVAVKRGRRLALNHERRKK